LVVGLDKNMTSDGKQLESLVSFVEQTLVPQGFDVQTNTKVFNDEGIQIAEFDVEIRGKIGTTDIAWLIECRDRPSQGAAPASWIEQLVGRRARFGFNKVTAVSTTGFAPGAKEFAESEGIELREVAKLSPEHFSDWLLMRDIASIKMKTHLLHATIIIREEESTERREELARVIAAHSDDMPLLRSISTGERVPLKNAFLGAVNGVEGLFDDIEPNKAGKRIKLHVRYTNKDDHFVVDTDLGEIRVESIIFYGELSIEQRSVPLNITTEYRQSKDGEVISQVAGFESQDMLGHEFALELHKLTETGETHVLLRKIK
jgi:hypothetical protein